MMYGGENGSQKGRVPSRRYTIEFKIEVVKLGRSVGCSEGSRRLGIPESSLFNWIKLERAGKLGASTGVTATPRSAKELEAENDWLRRELASAKVDNEILKSGGVLCQGVTVTAIGTRDRRRGGGRLRCCAKGASAGV
jgi:transposase